MSLPWAILGNTNKVPSLCLKVSQLILLNEAAHRDGIPLPDLVPSAQHIRQAVESLVLAGQKLVSETPDSVSFIEFVTYNVSMIVSLSFKK